MGYRLTYHMRSGEVRQIDYASRKSAFEHFRSSALASHVSEVRLVKLTDDGLIDTQIAFMVVGPGYAPRQPWPENLANESPRF